MTGKFLLDDLDAVFDIKDFAHDGGVVWNGVKITDVIFDDEDIEVETGQGVGEIVKQPMLTGRASDFQGLSDGDSILISGSTFTVKNWKDDATGVIEIFLSRSG